MYLINLLVSLFDGINTIYTCNFAMSFLYVTFVNKLIAALFTMVNTEEFIKGSKLY
jgi:hypothetical protein